MTENDKDLRIMELENIACFEFLEDLSCVRETQCDCMMSEWRQLDVWLEGYLCKKYKDKDKNEQERVRFEVERESQSKFLKDLLSYKYDKETEEIIGGYIYQKCNNHRKSLSEFIDSSKVIEEKVNSLRTLLNDLCKK